MTTKAVFNWSGGKDSALALYLMLQQKHVSIESLLTTISKEHQRISMHGVRRELLDQQAQHMNIPLTLIELPESTDTILYQEYMKNTMREFSEKGIRTAVFGDIFLEDLRAYRESQLAKISIRAEFPLWGKNTNELLDTFLKLGFKTIITCIDASKLDSSFVGRIIDETFIESLPSDVDPCGEHGEYHSFVFDGPIFSKPISFTKGEIVSKKYAVTNNALHTSTKEYLFCDLLPA